MKRIIITSLGLVASFSVMNLAIAAGTNATSASSVNSNPDTRPLIPATQQVQYPFYVGGIAGYGNTNWQQMVSQDQASTNSTPIAAPGSGFTAGLFVGYQLLPYFAVEANYMRFPDADVQFDGPNSFYGGVSQFNSKTNEYSVMGKFIVPIQHSKWSAFSEIGTEYTQRDDVLAEKGHIGLGVGVGTDYAITPRWMAELGFQYYTGYGVSETKPVYEYIPFLYTVNLRLAYRFSLF